MYVEYVEQYNFIIFHLTKWCSLTAALFLNLNFISGMYTFIDNLVFNLGNCICFEKKFVFYLFNLSVCFFIAIDVKCFKPLHYLKIVLILNYLYLQEFFFPYFHSKMGQLFIFPWQLCITRNAFSHNFKAIHKNGCDTTQNTTSIGEN